MSYLTIRNILLFTGLSLAATACATTERLVDRAGRVAEREAGERVDRGVSAGADATEDAILSGDEGNASASSGSGAANGASGSTGAARSAGSDPAARSITSNYDFQRGDRLLFSEDYSEDNLGDFPRGLELVDGSWDVVDVDGRRWLRETGGRGSAFQVVLPEVLPERFTIEYELMYSHGNQQTIMTTSPVDRGWTSYEGALVYVRNIQSGARMPAAGREFLAEVSRDILSDPTPVKVMVDGSHMKVYVNGQRVSNVPNAEVVRSDRLTFQDVYFSNPENPIFFGAIRVDAGGRDLYGALEREGRVTLEGIYFDTGSDQLRPESHAALAEVGAMLQEYSDLELSVEGHTDSQGDDGYNLDLSDRRAASVRSYLIQEFGIDPARLSSRGLGETQPVASNDTPEGRQQNRRVELVRIER
jgi:outer membrane protein OmpA-like peptidoglycan-associated protein